MIWIMQEHEHEHLINMWVGMIKWIQGHSQHSYPQTDLQLK